MNVLNISRILVKSLVALLFLGAVLPGFCLADSVNDAAKKMVRKINSQMTLSGQFVQFEAINLVDGETGERPMLNDHLYNAISEALVGKKAKVSAHLKGEEPLKLVGSYLVTDKAVIITLRLRKLTDSAAIDIATANASLTKKKLDPALFGASLSGLAASLITQLGDNYLESDDAAIFIENAAPGGIKQPSLTLGRELTKSLEKALSESKVFGGFYVVKVEEKHLLLKSSYTVSDDIVRFTAAITYKNGKVLTRATGKLKVDALPSDLFDMVREGGADVCVEYKAGSKRAVPSDSELAQDMVGEMISALNDAAINPTICQPGHKGMMVRSSLITKKRETPDGFMILMGTAKIYLLKDGTPVWQTKSKKSQHLSGDINEAGSSLVSKLYTPKIVEQLTKQILTAQ